MTLEEQLQEKINLKTKPLGALGQLEELAFQIGKVQNTAQPEIRNPYMLVFAGDHGIAEEGVSAYPSEVTHQMVLNFLQGGAAINVFSRLHDWELKVIDAGVDHDFDSHEAMVNAKVRKGTRNFLKEKAMTFDELVNCEQHARLIIAELAEEGSNLVGFGEMGIGNTSSASMIMSMVMGIPIEECVGRGTGVDDEGLKHKISVLQKAIKTHRGVEHPADILMSVGGYEIAMMAYAMVAAAEKRMLILVDGFIGTAAFLVADLLDIRVKRNAIFCHCSEESGHGKMLGYLNAKPLLNIGLRLGEGSGAALVLPLVKSAVAFLNEMASFEGAGVSEKKEEC